MTVNVAVNGYGRIGRMVLRALYESKRTGLFRTREKAAQYLVAKHSFSYV